MELIVWSTLVIVGMLWGFTNPLIKKGASGVEKIQEKSKIKQRCSEIFFLVTKFQFIVPFLLNQSGSFLYYFILRGSDLSIAVPVVNSLSFLFTGIAGWILGENPPNKGSLIGMVLILAGVACYLVDKMEN